MRLIFALLAVLLVAPAAAADAPPASPMEQALSSKLAEEYNQGINLRASLVQLQAQLTAAQARVKELEAKYEPAGDGAQPEPRR